MLLGFWPARSRRSVVAVGVAALLVAASNVYAQDAQAASAQAAPADPLKLTGDYVILINQVKPDKTADFESAWTAIKAKLSGSTNPDLKQLGDSLNIYKVNTPPQAGSPALYLFILNPPSKTQSYDPVKILYYAKPDPSADATLFERADADALYAKIKGSLVTINPWPLAKVGE